MSTPNLLALGAEVERSARIAAAGLAMLPGDEKMKAIMKVLGFSALSGAASLLPNVANVPLPPPHRFAPRAEDLQPNADQVRRWTDSVMAAAEAQVGVTIDREACLLAAREMFNDAQVAQG